MPGSGTGCGCATCALCRARQGWCRDTDKWASHTAPRGRRPADRGALPQCRGASRVFTTAAELKEGAPDPDHAAALAKRILLAWADHGLPRDAHGGFRGIDGLSCNASGKLDEGGSGYVPLHLGRGVIYSVHAQDLLQSFGALDAGEVNRLNAFHGAIFELIRQGTNRGMGLPQPACQRFTNGGANGIAALLAIARLVDDARRFNAVASGGDRATLLLLPWTRFFDGAIYGNADHPMECYLNTGPDALHSSPGFTTSIVAPGEVQDRYRNLGLLQTFGYPMFTLERLIDAAEVLRNAGFDPYAYRGNHGQSIEMAIEYYACYGKTPGFYKTVNRDNARDCPNHEQYEGKIVNGVDANVLVGAWKPLSLRSPDGCHEGAKCPCRALPVAALPKQ
jgi:hypothetical protein